MTTAAVDRPRASGARSLRAGTGRAVVMIPGAVLLIVFAVLPFAALLWAGFTTADGHLSAENFATVFRTGTYVALIGRTLGIALLVTVLSIAVGWPAAWALARHVSPRARSIILGLVIVPYITSQLLLIYGFITLVQVGGPIMSLTHLLGLTGPQDSIMYSPVATVLMLVYESIPTAVLVMYSASEQVDESLLEAARSLGAGRLRVFGTVIWPLAAPMLIANFALTFVQTVGAFAEPDLLGGPSGQMIGNVIAEQLNSGVGQQFAIALSLLLLMASLVVVALFAGGIRLSANLQRGRVARPERMPRPAALTAQTEGGITR